MGIYTVWSHDGVYSGAINAHKRHFLPRRGGEFVIRGPLEMELQGVMRFTHQVIANQMRSAQTDTLDVAAYIEVLVIKSGPLKAVAMANVIRRGKYYSDVQITEVGILLGYSVIEI